MCASSIKLYIFGGNISCDNFKASNDAVFNISDLSKIEEEFNNPMDLFNHWYEEAKKHVTEGLPHVCCLATVSK